MKITRNKAKMVISVATLCLFSLLVPTKSVADEIDRPYLIYLTIVSTELYKMLEGVNQYLWWSLIMGNSWTLPDKSDQTATVQGNFYNYTLAAQRNDMIQLDVESKLTNDFFNTTETLEDTFPNDITFSTLLGKPPINPDPRTVGIGALTNFVQHGKPIDPAYNYIKNMSGINIRHIAPNSNWKGSVQDKIKYSDFYNTISAIQTFNAYIASKVYAEFTSGTRAQMNLIEQANDSNWFATIASENVGYVIRQLLMYSSQQLVIQSELLKTQREVAAAQVMTNTLLIMQNGFTEQTLLRNATTSPSATPGT
ncbi:MAG: hypothetical protein SFW66_01590 [Gammaproteobacteria bacterium]|nr:hypothetical protein [Gammaproteobacteria bacterium]